MSSTPALMSCVISQRSGELRRLPGRLTCAWSVLTPSCSATWHDQHGLLHC